MPVWESVHLIPPWIPLYDFYFEDPCWDYAYYEWYRHACHRGYDRIHLRHNYSVVSVEPLTVVPTGDTYYWPYGYSSYSHFSLSFGLQFRIRISILVLRIPLLHALLSHVRVPRLRVRGLWLPSLRLPRLRLPRLRLPRLWCRTVREEQNGICDDPAHTSAYPGSPLVRSSPLYKESPRAGAQRTATARSDHVRKSHSHTDLSRTGGPEPGPQAR